MAIGTPTGRGGLGCVRLSGPQAHAIARRLFAPHDEPQAGGPPALGRFLCRDGAAIDHGFLVLFHPERSYTGEPAAELWAHGSPAVLAELVAAALGAGAETAGPGELTYRAVRSGRIDLSRAEAVRDLIDARTLWQARLAFSQVEGGLARRLAPLREALVDAIARAEAAVEFVDESETHLPGGALARAIADARRTTAALLAESDAGRLVREGASLVLTGRPNVGKSSLFNRLLARERAIVTAEPGTTRDTLEEGWDLGGIPVRLVDTAGLRDPLDPAESEGVRRARAAREEADLVVLVLDGTREPDEVERAALARIAEGPEAERAVVAVNKVDLEPAAGRSLPAPGALRVSALTGEGLPELREALRERLLKRAPLEDPVITNARHAHALERAHEALDRATRALDAGLTEEIALEDLRAALDAIGEITGETTTDDLYARIFSTFCIGK